jgi:hypothetical protein
VQQEKADHKKTHDDLSTQLEIEKTKRAREVLEATNKLASLQQHYKLLQVTSYPERTPTDLCMGVGPILTLKMWFAVACNL